MLLEPFLFLIKYPINSLSLIHTKIARTLIRHFPNTVQDIIEVNIGAQIGATNYAFDDQGEEYHGLTPLHLAIAYGNDELAEVLFLPILPK